MEHCSIAFLQIAEEFQQEYLTRSNEGIDFWLSHMKKHRVLQSIRGASFPKFFVTVANWEDEEAFYSYLDSEDRIQYSTKYVQFYGDRYLYKVLHKSTINLSDLYKPRFCSFVRYIVKKDKIDEFLNQFYDFLRTEDLVNDGIDQSLLLQNPDNPSLIANITIWNSKENALNFKITEKMEEFVQTYLEHPRDTILFDISTLLSRTK